MWRSRKWTGFSMAQRPMASVAPTTCPPLMPPPATHMVKPMLWWSRPLLPIRPRRAAELAAPQDERRIQQAPAFQILNQAGDRLVGLGGHPEVVLLDVGVRIPLEVAGAAAGDHADEAHAVLDQPPRQQAAAAVVVRRFSPAP